MARPAFLIFVVAGVLAIVYRRAFARSTLRQHQSLIPKALLVSESSYRIMTLVGGILFIVCGLLATADTDPLAMTRSAFWLSTIDFIGVGVAIGGGILILLQRQRLAVFSLTNGWGPSKDATLVWITVFGILLTLTGVYALGMSIPGWLLAE